VAVARVVGNLLQQKGGGDSDLRPLPGLINGALTRFFGAEGRYLKKFRLPVGVSLIAVAEHS
jgi:hypothetical protein